MAVHQAVSCTCQPSHVPVHACDYCDGSPLRPAHPTDPGVHIIYAHIHRASLRFCTFLINDPGGRAVKGAYRLQPVNKFKWLSFNFQGHEDMQEE